MSFIYTKKAFYSVNIMVIIMEKLYEAFIHQLSDLYSAENQILQTLINVAKHTSHEKLLGAFNKHIEETKIQINRLEQISNELVETFDEIQCKALKGLSEEANELLNEEYDNDTLRDIMLVSIVQKIEHYEIAGYGTVNGVNLRGSVVYKVS
jgi:ferritin-like metal-binding protein YciE